MDALEAALAAASRTPREARDAGIDFLLRHQRPSGMWVDFRLAPGWSDEWTTGYVGDRLARSVREAPGGNPRPAEALDRAWVALRERTHVRPAGWGYNALVPQDADSTAWALRLAHQRGDDDAIEAVSAHASMGDFRAPNGMFRTYGPDGPIAQFIGADAGRDLTGWTSPHACVTAAAAAVPGLVPSGTLESCQEPDGRWRSYWWTSDAFATALAVEALGPGSASARAAIWARDSLASGDRHTAFESANLIIATFLGGLGHDPVVTAAVGTLTAAGRPDGSWTAGAVMRVPDPDDREPDLRRTWIDGGRIEGAIVIDERRHFTTATVVRALSLAAAGMGG